MKKRILFFFLCTGILFLFFSCQKKQQSDTYQSVFDNFKNPPNEFKSVPFWVWNDAITREQIETQLMDFQQKGMGGVFIHPRPGLITPYLSEEWLSLCRFAVEEGRSRGMKVWLYDENSYPSGFAGGHVPAEMPDAVLSGLQMKKMGRLSESFEVQPAVVLMKNSNKFEDITSNIQEYAGKTGDFYVFEILRQSPSSWYGGFTYVDLLRREVTEKFLDITLNAYKRTLGEEFGQTVPGVFQDEAHISPPGGRDVINYTPALFESFQTKWGYDLRTHLPSLYEEEGEWKKVRHNFYALLLELFIDNWAVPYYEYGTDHNLIFTGHYWEHEWPRPRINPDNMALYAYAHMPGIDMLMNEWSLDPHAQFGNARAVKELRSAANQLGRKRTLSETYGAGGWEMTFFDQKRIGDWEYALGVNFLNQHLSYVSIKGARKRDHPLSFSYHEPWWHAYPVLADYFARLSVAMSYGVQKNRILVIEPTTTAWMYYSPAASSDRLESLGKEFQNFVHDLEAEQIEYDLGSEEILLKHGSVDNNKLAVGACSYDLVVLSPGLDNLNSDTIMLLEKFLAENGKIICWKKAPEYIDGMQSDRVTELASQYGSNWVQVDSEDGWNKIRDFCPQGIVFHADVENQGRLFHHRRRLQDAELVFLVNSSDREEYKGFFTAEGNSCEHWDPFSGRVTPYPFEKIDGQLKIDFMLPPGGSLLLCLRPGAAENIISNEQEKRIEISASSELTVQAISPNILTLDYCDLSLSGRWIKDLYFYEAQEKIFQHHGLDRNPWDHAVQYKSNILDMDKFPSDSGFEVIYRFNVSEGVDLESLQVVIERPELYRVSINGIEIHSQPEIWWLDRDFGVFEIGEHVRTGQNSVRLKAEPFTIHTELEPIYLLGNFSLKSQDKGFFLIPSETLSLGSWKDQGRPFYSGGVSYNKKYNISLSDEKSLRWFIHLGEWSGSVAEVLVNGRQAGFIAFQPYELDISNFVQDGENEVEVIVYGTLKNTLGPFHNDPPLGRAWPNSFREGAKSGYPPGSEYSVVAYGLFEEFSIYSSSQTMLVTHHRLPSK